MVKLSLIWVQTRSNPKEAAPADPCLLRCTGHLDGAEQCAGQAQCQYQMLILSLVY